MKNPNAAAFLAVILICIGAFCAWAARSEVPAMCSRLGATVVKIVPSPDENAWRIELKIPTAVRRLHMPLSGDPVRFTVKLGVLEHEVSGVYQFRRGHSCVILDDAGGEWEAQSMWQMKKL